MLVISGVYLLYSAFKDVEEEAVKQLHQQQLVHAIQAANNIREFFTNYHTRLNYFAQKKSVLKMDIEGKLLVEHFYKSNSHELNAVTRVDSSGKIMFTIPENRKLIGSDISFQEHIKKLRKTHHPVLSNIFLAVQGFKTIAFYVPVFKDSIFAGGLAVLVRFDELTKNSLKEISIKESGFAWLMNQEGTILYHPNSNYLNKPALDVFRDSESAISMIKKILKGESGIASYESHLPGDKDSKMEALYYPVKIVDNLWTIIVATPRIEVIKDMKGFLIKWSTISILLITGIVYFSFNIIKAKTVIREEVERKKAAQALASSEKKFRTLVEVSPDSIILTDLSGNIKICNHKTVQILGYMNTDELINKNVTDLVAPEDKTKVNNLLQKTINKEISGELELCFFRKNGSSFTVEVNTAVLLNEQEQPIAIAAIARDVTERKKNQEALTEAKEKAEKSDTLKSEFLAQMSHEIRSPINTILSFASLLKEEIHDTVSDDLKISFSGIDNAGKRIIRTIDMILNMSEIQIGTYEPVFHQVNLFKDILEKLFVEFKQTASDKGLELFLINNIPHKDIFIYADEYTLVQIFDNLINNAIKYTDSGSVQIIISNIQSTKILIEIKDTGIGISDEFIPRLFEPFGQEEQGYTRRYEGNGLGLALVKKYCDINNLDLEVESEKGIGSNFKVIYKMI
ncbi:MAG: PAS domain S-box protein [Ignavibacteriales bacterium]|nr:PAS domain S-box protein [Ignavibacteriales bacterium]